VTERSVSVRLIAITAQYNEAMKESGKVTTDLGTAAELTGTKSGKAGKDVDAFGDSIDRASTKAKDAKASFSPLVLSIAALGPALVPLAGGAVAVAGALGGMGTAAALAFGGIKDQMAQGTELGKTYTGQLALLKDNLETLQTTAAAGVLGPFEAAVADLQKQMPFLNATIGTFSTITGQTALNLEQGFLGALHALMPLFVDLGVYVEGLSKRLEQFATGGGLQKFGAWAQAELPKVEQFLNQITAAVFHLLAAFAPLGSASLSTLTIIARAINELPLPVLQALIPLLVNAYLGFKAFQGLSIVVDTLGALSARLAAVTVATGESAAAARAASLAYRGMEAAAGPIGVALVLAGTAMTYFSTSSDTGTRAVDDFKNALVSSKGAIDANVLSMVSLKLQQDGLADKAAKSGVSLADLTAAVVGTDAQFNALAKSWQAAGDPSGFTLAKLSALHIQFKDGAKSAAQENAALAQLTGTLNGSAGAAAAVAFQVEELAGKYGATTDQVQAFAEQNKLSLDGTDKSSTAFIKAADKAVLLGTTLNQLRNDAIGLTSPFTEVTTRVKDFTDALAQESTMAGGDVVRSQETLQKSLNSLAQTLHTGKGAFDDYSDAGLASHAAIDQAATDASKYASEVFKQTGSITEAITAYDNWYNALIATGRAQGVGKQQIDDYLASVGQLPQQVSAALQGTQDASTKAAAAMTDAMISGLTQGLGPLEATLNNLIVALGGTAAIAAVGVGQYLGGTINSSMADRIDADNSPEVAATNKALRLALAADAAYAAGEQVGNAYVVGLSTVVSSSTASNLSGTYNSQVPGTGSSVTKAFVPPSLHVGTFGGIHVGSLAPPTAKTGGSTKTPAQLAQQKIVAQDDLLNAQALAAIGPTNKLALAQEAVTDATRRLNNETTAGTLAYYQDLTKLHQAQQALTDEVKAEAQARADAQKKLAADTKAEAALLAQEATVTAQFYADLNKAAADHAAKDTALIQARQAALEGWASASQKATIQWGSSISWLTGNVNDQVNQFTQWEQALAVARTRGVSEGVISALGLDQGPQALGQLKQFANATQDQIDALNKAVAAKNAAAGDEAHTEAVNSYGQLGKDLLAEQQTYADAVTALQTKFASDMAALAQQVQQAQATIGTDQQTINALPAQYGHVANMAALAALPQGTALYTKSADGSYVHIADPSALSKLAPGTPIYDKLYDSGGILPPGKTVAYNATGRNEHVLTDAQLAAVAGGGEVTVIAQVVLDGKVIDQQITKHNAGKRQAILVGGVRQ
jgi:hypothetical protein